jgi:tagatose-6-phosphate ketose/aldose isomerase
VRISHHFLRIQPALLGPLAPDPAHGGSRVNQHAIKVEKQTAADDFGHDQVLAEYRNYIGVLKRKHLIPQPLSFTVSDVSIAFLLRQKTEPLPVLMLEHDLLQELARSQDSVAALLARSPEEQQRLGYFHTLREICQQPATWVRTSELMAKSGPALFPSVQGLTSLILTGSGSSEYAGDCVRIVLQEELRINVQAASGGTLLTHGSRALPIGRPALMVSLARSGDSPESVGALALMLKIEPELRHLVLTCNRQGSLAHTFREDPRVVVITLDDRTNDRSLVMTSSFTNLVLAARFLGLIHNSSGYQAICSRLADTATTLLQTHFDALARVAKAPFRRALFLGSGARFAAAREAALKMLEATAGRVMTSCETYLGLRHGPMSAVHDDTLVVCFLSSEARLRAYETDVLQELAQKRLGLFRVIAGQGVHQYLLDAKDVAIPYDQAQDLEDGSLPVLDVVVGQILGLFRCLAEGLRPDSPSAAGVIQRVVQSFRLHLPNA